MSKIMTVLSATAVAAAIAGAFADEPTGKPSNANLAKFIPAGYRILEEVRGDLNGDGVDDYVLIIKATDKKNFGSNPGFDEIVDLNPRGLLILFSDGNDYRRVQENRRCFESEDVVPSPYILVSVKKGNLYISYSDKNNDVIYTFRHRNSEFELIGNDNGCDGCEGFSHDNKRSINFLTKKQLVKTCAKYKGYECIKFEETWSNITIKKPIRLRDFCSDDFYLDKYIDYKK